MLAERLANKGIIINVEIGIDLATAEALRASDLHVPNPVPCQALIDTGSSILAVDQSIAQSLNLVKRGIYVAHTANGQRQCNLYAVALTFPSTNLKSYSVIQASEVNLSAQPFKCLIGRDVLRNWHVHYNGETGAVSIAD
ncbi:MAG: retroviral-like aspartic protease family protein [Candidatus Bathyarchaeia archaeon]